MALPNTTRWFGAVVWDITTLSGRPSSVTFPGLSPTCPSNRTAVRRDCQFRSGTGTSLTLLRLSERPWICSGRIFGELCCAGRMCQTESTMQKTNTIRRSARSLSLFWIICSGAPFTLGLPAQAQKSAPLPQAIVGVRSFSLQGFFALACAVKTCLQLFALSRCFILISHAERHP